MSLIWGRVLILTGDDWTARSFDSTMTISRATQAVKVLRDNLQGFRSVVSGSYTLTAHLLLLGKPELLCVLHNAETGNARFWFNPSPCGGFGEFLWFSWKKSGFCKSLSASLVSFVSACKAG